MQHNAGGAAVNTIMTILLRMPEIHIIPVLIYCDS